MQKIKSKTFSLKREATDWAKSEKKKFGPGSGIKWETNRSTNDSRPWEAVLYKDTGG